MWRWIINKPKYRSYVPLNAIIRNNVSTKCYQKNNKCLKICFSYEKEGGLSLYSIHDRGGPPDRSTVRAKFITAVARVCDIHFRRRLVRSRPHQRRNGR